MAHFAEIDENGVVLQVLVVPDAEENRGQEFLANDLGLGGTWVQTSYNARIRKNYAGIGMSYDAGRDAFIAPKPYESWVLNEDTCQYEAPTPRPNSVDGEIWTWNEENLEWELLNV
jgi:hypothetical protein